MQEASFQAEGTLVKVDGGGRRRRKQLYNRVSLCNSLSWTLPLFLLKRHPSISFTLGRSSTRLPVQVKGA
jgi:hypothetical protein